MMSTLHFSTPLYRLLLSLTLCTLAGSAWADHHQSAAKSAETPIKSSAKSTKTKEQIRLDGMLSTTLYLRNDTDFDPSPRFDDLDGQRDGQFATFFNPTLTIDTGKQVLIKYQMEIGWNAWGLNNPSQPQQFMAMPGQAVQGRHRLLWGAWRSKSLSVRFGFQEIKDPSGMFLNHTVGAIRIQNSWGPHRLKLVFAQLPDTTYEGIGFNRDYITDDNLTTDRFLVGSDYRMKHKRLKLHFALYGLSDESLFNRALRIGTAVFAAKFKAKNRKYWLHVLGQGGWQDKASALNEQVDHRAWAVQAGAQIDYGAFDWSIRGFGLSGDDDADGNRHQGAFFGAAKNLSKTRLFTEDESRDRYDNLDERMGSYLGVLAFNPAGIMVADFSMGYEVNDWYRVETVMGIATTMNPARAMGARYMGTEVTLTQRVKLSEAAQVFLTALALLPGEAAAVLINDQDRQAQQTLYGMNLGIAAQF